MLGKKQIKGKKSEWFSWYLDKKAKLKLTLSKSVKWLPILDFVP